MSKEKPIKVHFKKCSKQQWIYEPSYVVFFNNKDVGEIYFFEDESEPTFEFEPSNFDLISFTNCIYLNAIIMEAMSEVTKKLSQFKQEVMAENKKLQRKK